MAMNRVQVKLQLRSVLVVPATGEPVLVVRFPDEILRLFGQATSIFVEGRVFDIDANAQVQFGVFTGALGGERPYPDGKQLSLTIDGGNPTSWITVTQAGRFRFEATSGMQVVTEPVMIVKRTDSPPWSNAKEVELEVWASLELPS